MAATSFIKLYSFNRHLVAVLQSIGLTGYLFFDWPRITLPPLFEYWHIPMCICLWFNSLHVHTLKNIKSTFRNCKLETRLIHWVLVFSYPLENSFLSIKHCIAVSCCSQNFRRLCMCFHTISAGRKSYSTKWACSLYSVLWFSLMSFFLDRVPCA